MNKKVEILSPAGSYESLKAAITAGADAVYIGGTRFGARAFANNLSEEMLLEVIDYVHLHGRKIYLTVNTLLKEQELMTELYEYLLPYYKQGLDAVIVQDVGVMTFIKEHFPDLPIHASTQMTITDLLGAKFMEKQGVERIVTAREMNIDEIKEITTQTNVEVESFVHGALCYCYSGQCLYSSLLGGRSGNRGQCAQPCRLPYKMQGEKEAQYILSLKDICTLEYIPQLIESGIYSFKIEGRMKKPEYVALVTKMYRKYVDRYLENPNKPFKVEQKDKEMLLDLYNRGGSHGGYYYSQNGREMVSLTRPNHAGVPALKVVKVNGKTVTAKAIVDIFAGDIIELPDVNVDKNQNFTFANGVKQGQSVSFMTHKKQQIENGTILSRIRNESLIQNIRETILNQKIKEKMDGKLILSEGIPAKLMLSCEDAWCGKIIVSIEGEPVQTALNQPMDAARIEKQMRKTGNTEFEFQNLEIELHGNIFMPMQSLNELRRNGIEALEEKILSHYRRNQEILVQKEKKDLKGFVKENETNIHVYVEEVEQLKEVLHFESVKRIYLDANALEKIWKHPEMGNIIDMVHQQNKEIYLAFPHIFRKATRLLYEAHYETICGADWDGILVRNHEGYEFLFEHDYQGNIVTDYNIYHFNRYAKAFWEEQKIGSNFIESFTAPFELNYKELKKVGLENAEVVVYGHQPMMVSAQCIMKTTKGCKKRKSCLNFVDRYQKTFAVKNCCDYCYNIIYNTAPLSLLDQREELQELSPKALRLHFTIENKKQVKEILSLYEKVFVNGERIEEPNLEFTRGHFKRGIV